MRALRWMGPVAMVTAGMAGCGDEDAASRTAPAPAPTTLVEAVPVREDATSGPGTELDAGFSVVEGSVLLGAVFPAVYEGSRGAFDRETRALLLVTGDARQVFDAYADQAAAIGLPVGPTASTGQCGHDLDPTVFRCAASAEQGDPSTAYRSVRIVLWRAPVRGDRPPASHVFVRYGERGGPPYEGPVSHPQVAGPGSGNPPLPGDWPSLPEVGDPYESGYAQSPLVVEEGTELVAHPSLSGGCSPGGGSTAVFRVLDDPEGVLNAVARQQPSNEVSSIEKTVEGDDTLRRISWRQGGGSYTAWTVERSGESAYLMVDHCTAD